MARAGVRMCSILGTQGRQSPPWLGVRDASRSVSELISKDEEEFSR